ncbi:hypothetical protein [Puia sp.]|jgi:hypothetical protein|uniref:hypothetical protein n=1 Tax=Puia sp. TaxID=2045100 RepID=UPI002F404DAB
MSNLRHLCLLLLVPLTAFLQGPTHKITLLDGKVELQVPDQFHPMSDQEFQQRFRHGTSKPSLVLTDSTSEVTLTGVSTSMPATEDDMAAFALFQYQDLRKKHPDTEFPPHAHGTLIINGKKIGYLKFMPHAQDQVGFTWDFFALVDGKVLLLDLTCPISKQKLWDPIADQIIHSLKINSH